MSNIILPNEDNGNKIIKPGDLLFPTIDINRIQQEPDITEKDMGNAGFKDPRAVNDLKYIIKDILSGDPNAAKRPEYTSLGYEQMKTAIKWLEQQGLDEATLQLLLEKPYLLTFKDKPPTPEEFLTSKYIGSQAESVWWPVKKNFLQFFDPLKPYRTAVLNPSIGSGKSTFTMLALLYVACHFALMRDPWKFFGKSRTTVFIIALCAVTQGKAKEIYNEPLRQLIESASFWHWCRTHQEMLNEEKHLQESDTIEYIPWTTAVDAAQPLDAKVYLPDGTFKKMGDLQIGDEIASPTSGTTIVEGFPFEGETDIYEIELDDGRKTRCSLHHKWIVAWEKDINGEWIWKEVTTEFMLSHEDLEFEIYEGPKTKIIKEKSLDNCD